MAVMWLIVINVLLAFLGVLYPLCIDLLLPSLSFPLVTIVSVFKSLWTSRMVSHSMNHQLHPFLNLPILTSFQFEKIFLPPKQKTKGLFKETYSPSLMLFFYHLTDRTLSYYPRIHTQIMESKTVILSIEYLKIWDHMYFAVKCFLSIDKLIYFQTHKLNNSIYYIYIISLPDIMLKYFIWA